MYKKEHNDTTGRDKYYKDNPESMRKRNENRMWVNGKYIPPTHDLHKPGRYKSFNDAAFEGLGKYSNIKEGYVYALTNPAWRGWVKIGMAIDVEDRVNAYQTSSPFRDFHLRGYAHFSDRRKAESDVHDLAKSMSNDYVKEWFKLSWQNALELIEKVKSRSISDMTDEERKRAIERSEANKV